MVGSTWLQRDSELPGTGMPLATATMPGIIGGVIAFFATIGVAYTIAAEREDGTMLRAKAIPHGLAGYLTGQVVRASLETTFGMAIIIVPSLLLFEDLSIAGPGRWFTFVWVTILGLLATLPIGAMIGSVVGSAQRVGTWGTSVIVALAMVSGIFVPLAVWADWVQTLAQVFPVYWLELGMRYVFLPEAAMVAEMGGAWQPLATAVVLMAWAVLGAVAAPAVLRRASRRESGSAMEARRQRVVQRAP